MRLPTDPIRNERADRKLRDRGDRPGHNRYARHFHMAGISKEEAVGLLDRRNAPPALRKSKDHPLHQF